MNSGYLNLANAISGIVDAGQRKKYTTARVGIVSGNSVVSQGRSYSLSTAIDINAYSGRTVYFVLSSAGRAVIIGG